MVLILSYRSARYVPLEFAPEIEISSKNHFLAKYVFLEMQERLQIIRAEVIKTISDDSHLIRVTGSIVITTIASRIGLTTWPELFPAKGLSFLL